ncbi:MAG: TolC family protein, partial [Pseudomonadota bacterium]
MTLKFQGVRSLELVFPALLSLSLIGCTTVSTRIDEASDRTRASLPTLAERWSTVQSDVTGEPVGWIAAFDDPVLVGLVAEAQANNQDLAVAAANVDRSRASAGLARAALSPQVSVGAGVENTGIVDGSDQSTGSVGVEGSWELDLWGRLRSGQEEARRSLEAVEADFRYSQHAIAAAVAHAYFLAIETNRQLAIARSTVTALAETDRIVQVRFENGLGDASDVALSRSNLATAKNDVLDVEGAQRSALRALELLLGRYPDADIAVREALPSVPPPPPVGVPSTILERRPDLIAAERRVAAALADVDEAQAAKLPSFTLTGSFGGASDELSEILDPSNLAWTLASNLVAPVIDGGARDRQVEIAEA